MQKWKLATLILVAAAMFAAAFATIRSPAAEPGSDAPATAAVTIRLRIDLSERRLYVEENGERIGSYDVAVGTKAHPTPQGSFSIRRIIWNPRWVPPNADWAKGEKVREPGDPKNPMGRVKIFFRAPDYYIHGTNAESSIGTAASHGCVRMLNADVIALATLLMEHGGAAVEPGLIQRLINRVRQLREVRLTNPVPLRVAP